MLTLLSLVLAAEAGSPLLDYQRARADLESRRIELATDLKKHPAQVRQQARAALLAYFENSAFPAWKGTTWNFYGTTITPREGTIACGYYVTTVLEQAGFHLQRVRLAQQASAYVVSTLARGTRVEWIRPAGNAEAVEEIRHRFGDGLFVIGFDYHVGFLRLEGERAAFCHSSFIDPGSVTCEDPVPSGAFVSRTYVVADALNDQVLEDWLLGRTIPSQLPKKPRRD
ncbi:MAG: hypothetical protein Q8N23_07625 [Archangium sp.]|nr:hypothetical protein [Archangium sp.]MDP3152523.1 hypothetical protein [Archangium sp.]MDP3572307.1 hypothetical protein [Archangium sp.]